MEKHTDVIDRTDTFFLSYKLVASQVSKVNVPSFTERILKALLNLRTFCRSKLVTKDKVKHWTTKSIVLPYLQGRSKTTLPAEACTKQRPTVVDKYNFSC